MTVKKWARLDLDWLFLGLLVAVNVLVYSNTFDVPFYLDDENFVIYQDIQIKTLSLSAIKKAAFANPTPNRPLSNLTFALNYYFHGLQVKGFHIVNLFIHLLAGVALFCFLKLTLRLSPQNKNNFINSSVIPFLAALLWSVHPIQIQSVTYIIQRMNSLAALFFLISLILYVLGRQSASRNNRYGYFFASALSGILGCLSKEQVVILPVIIGLYEWYFFQNLRFDWLKKRKLSLAVIFILPLAVFLVMTHGNPMQMINREYSCYYFDAPQRLMTEMRILIFYLTLFLLPHPSRLNLEHEFSISTSLFTPVTTLFSLVFILGLIVFAIHIARRERFVSFCILWYFITHLIESTIIPLELVYEHRNYIPSMLVLCLVVVLNFRFISFRYGAYLLPVLLIVAFSFWTYQRNALWTDSLKFYEDCVAKSPNSWRVWDNLGVAYFNDWQNEKAIEAYSKSIALRDNIWGTHQNLANALNRQGRHVEALDHLMTARDLLSNMAMREQENKVVAMIRETKKMIINPPRRR